MGVEARRAKPKRGCQMALTWPLEQQGSTGEDVKTVQYLVTAQGHATGVDGSYGPLTKAAVQAFQSSLSTQPFLIITALLAVYIVLGILYESYIHPITIISTLPSAGVGAGRGGDAVVVADGGTGGGIGATPLRSWLMPAMRLSSSVTAADAMREMV